MDRRKTEHHNQGERDEAGTAAARDPAATQSPLKETRKKRNREEIVNDRDEKHVKEKKDKDQEDEKQDDAKIEKESEFSEEEVFRGIESASFKLTDSSNLYLHRGDITLWFVDGQYDAIVNAANKGLLGGGGVDRAIHMAAGPSLLEACRKIPKVFQNTRCPVGEARITSGFNLKAAYCIHTVGPIYEREEDPAAKLKDSYRNSLELANRNAINYISFPAVSCGVYGFPYEEAAEIALTTVQESAGDIKEVHFVLFEMPAWKAWLEKAQDLFDNLSE